MTSVEMSNELDTLLNAYSQNPDFGKDTNIRDIRLDEYEKSVLLTHAQESIVKNYFQKNTSADGNGFDDSERRQIDYSTLITTNGNSGYSALAEASNVFDDLSVAFKFPKDVLYVLNERVAIYDIVTSGNSESKTKVAEYVIVPINYNDYDRYQSKPFTRPLRKQAWRLLSNGSYKENSNDKNTVRGKIVEIILRDGLDTNQNAQYKIRYVRRPVPILTQNFAGMDLTFAGYDSDDTNSYGPQDCELDPIMHRDIVNEAARLAIISRGGGRTQLYNQDRATTAVA